MHTNVLWSTYKTHSRDQSNKNEFISILKLNFFDWHNQFKNLNAVFLSLVFHNLCHKNLAQFLYSHIQSVRLIDVFDLSNIWKDYHYLSSLKWSKIEWMSFPVKRPVWRPGKWKFQKNFWMSCPWFANKG